MAARRLAVLRGARQFAGCARVRRGLGRMHPRLHQQLLHRDPAGVRPRALRQRHVGRRTHVPRTSQLPRSVLRRRDGIVIIIIIIFF